MLPASRDLALEPSVHLNDPVTTAIEVMIRHNRDTIAVFWNKRPVGQVRLRGRLCRDRHPRLLNLHPSAMISFPGRRMTIVLGRYA